MKEIEIKISGNALTELQEIFYMGNSLLTNDIIKNAITLYKIMLREQKAGTKVILDGKINIATEKHLREIGFDNIRVKQYWSQKIEHSET